MWKRRLDRLNRLRPLKGALLDVGCAEGLFPFLAWQAGWQTVGTEVSAYSAEYARETYAVRVEVGELPEIGFPDRSFDAVTLWHVLEHMTDPPGALREIRRILKPGGVLLLAVPNTENYLSRMVYRVVKGRRMHLFHPSDRELHLVHFTARSIRLLLEKAGFRVMKAAPDLGIVDRRMKALNLFAAAAGHLAGRRILTDAVEVYAVRP